jgi:hypothetical protein
MKVNIISLPSQVKDDIVNFLFRRRPRICFGFSILIKSLAWRLTPGTVLLPLKP